MNTVFSAFIFCLGLIGAFAADGCEIDRGNFFHTVYRIQQKLGRTFRELEPFSLFPLDEYFGGSIVKARPVVSNLLIMPGSETETKGTSSSARRNLPQRKEGGLATDTAGEAPVPPQAASPAFVTFRDARLIMHRGQPYAHVDRRVPQPRWV